MNCDISRLLSDWQYEPGQVSARWVAGEDGSRKVQLRLDLGIFQMEPDDRPDGSAPHGYPSLMAYYRTLEHTSRNGALLKLDEDACADLQQEAVQYYYRYLSYQALEEHERVAKDTAHNLEIFNFVSKHADDEEYIWQFMQFYPEVKATHTKARARQAAMNNELDEAAHIIRQGLKDVRKFWQENGDFEPDDPSREEDSLTELLAEIRKKQPVDQVARIQAALNRAISMEQFEKAADLRDKLRELTELKSVS